MSARPKRRAAARAIDYSKEQEFSDGDVFGDDEGPGPGSAGAGDDEPAAAAAANRRSAPRRSTGNVGRLRRSMDGAEHDPHGAGAGAGAGTGTGTTGGSLAMSAGSTTSLYSSPRHHHYTERGYDPTLPPIRERFTFEPEMEEDGTSKIDLIVGRRPIDDRAPEDDDDEEEEEEDEDGEDKKTTSGTRSKSKSNRKRPSSSPRGSPARGTPTSPSKHVDYEYLIKYRGKSYLHLEWMTPSDLESMNKSAKNIYRRYIKKIQSGVSGGGAGGGEGGDTAELEDPEFDPEFIRPERIVDEKEEEVMEDLSDKDLVEWEKRQKEEMEGEEEEEMGEEGGEEDGDGAAPPPPVGGETTSSSSPANGEEEKKNGEDEQSESIPDFEIGEPGTLTIEQLRKLVYKDGPYYPQVEGSDNPYRDGYVTEPPKKPRVSYLFFQSVYRPVYTKKHPGKNIMPLMGDAWRGLGEEGQAPFAQIAQEEMAQYEHERSLLDKAQKASEVWQPLRRCEMVLNRLSEDEFAEIFQEPVDVNAFPDYEDVVEFPMDLSTIRAKLKETAWSRKYQAPENFARDMRKIWNNCKIYNQHGSAIWHVADFMSKRFERLYHAWVLEFRTRYLRWSDPRARPWENSCRKCDGKECGATDEEIVLCDHCDAHYGMSCLRPPLTEIPPVWHCPDCVPKLVGEKGSRMLSAVTEYAARKRAELGDVPKKKVLKRLYLVKWAGLGYEQCTWETAEDINDDELIAEYRRLNNMTPDEPELMHEDVDKVLVSSEAHIKHENAGGKWCVPDLRSQLYSQTRAMQFSKFGMDIPGRLAVECGPKTKASALASVDEQGGQLVEEASTALSSLVDKISRGQTRTRLHESLPPCLTGEYDVVVPITSKGLMMNVGELDGSISFLGYRRFDDGSLGPSEKKRLIRNNGDRIVAVDGVSTVDKSFKDVIGLLKESGKNSFAHMRFLEQRFQLCRGNLTSVGTEGRFATDELHKKFKTDRRRQIAKRRQELDDETDLLENGEESDGSVNPQSDSDSDSDSKSEGSEGEFEPDSEDEELIIKQQKEEQIASQQEQPSPTEPSPDASTVAAQGENAKEGGANTVSSGPSEKKQSADLSVAFDQETTKSLAYRLLGVDIGYSSDEGGDEDCAHFIDGVDSTFITKQEASVNDDEGARDSSIDGVPLPVKRNEFSTLGDRAKLVAAMAVVGVEGDPDDFDNYPLPSTKELAAKRKQAEDEAKRASERLAKEEEDKEDRKDEVSKPVKLSRTKVEQVDTRTNEVIRVWAKAEDAAATLQLSLEHIRQVLAGEYDEDLGDEVGGYRWRFAAANAEVTKTGATGPGSKKGKQAFLQFRDKLYDHEKPHVYKNENKLRDYQIDGVNWLASCWYKRHSCILADEMGLGKTVQIVAYVEHLQRVEKIKGPFLIVVPLSTVEHWRREFEGWTDMRCCVYHDRQRVWRDVMREYEWYYADRPHTPDYLKFDVLVTTYDTLIGDFDVMGQIPWRVAVVDEAHRLRNIKGKLLECMKEISARGTLEYGYQSRVLMTGTPLQNNTQELWTLLNFIEPFKFPNLEEFEADYGDMNNRNQVEALQRRISPYMLRRVKEDVAKDIPSKEETLIDVELTSIQKQYYRAIFEHNHSFLSMGAARNSAPKLNNIQMELRKCCNHPFLLDGVETREMENCHKELYESGAFEGKTADEVQDMLNVHGYIQTSGKLVLLDKLLPKLRKEGHKVLIFSQMVKMLDLLSEYMDFRGFKHETLTGRVRGNERQKAIDRFNTEEDSFAFLLSTRAGGVGINLTAADICIIFDSDWNPQNDVQAQARCHRIGQTKDVRIYRLITSRTFEQEMFDRASKKLGLEQAVLGTFDQNDDDGKPTAKEMEQLLKKGAYALMEDDGEDEEFCADDIESILAKRTRTRVVEGAKTASWLNKAGMNVTKSKFTGDGKSAGIDVDDPLFWQKVMPDFVTPTIMMEKLKELEEEIEDRPRGPGRGRKKKTDSEKKPDDGGEEEKVGDSNDINASNQAQVDEETETRKEKQDDEKIGEEKEDEGEKTSAKAPSKKKGKVELTKSARKKLNKFMADLTSMMDDIFERDEDDNLPQDEKAVCQQLLLTISVKANLFTHEQQTVAKVLLKRLEGDRRRRCRTTDDHRFVSMTTTEAYETGKEVVPEALLIRSTKKKKKKRRREEDEDDEGGDKDEPSKKRRKKKPVIGEDGFKEHSDSEGDWSDVGESIYELSRKRATISKKEANRRRAWASDKDPAAAAGRAWPSFPRNVVSKVLGAMLVEMIKYDQTKGGLFSVPVPKDDFPEYYEMVKQPMDYGTMKLKLENGEYRSAQAMQKDFHLVMKNCLQFNSPDSDIVQEARQQALLRPKMLKEAAMKQNLFIAEDGTVFNVIDEEKKADKKKKKSGEKAKQRFVRCKACDACKREDCGKCKSCLDMVKFGGEGKVKSSCLNRKCENPQARRLKPATPSKKGKSDGPGVDGSDDSDADESVEEKRVASQKKPRIKIKLGKGKKRKADEVDDLPDEDAAEDGDADLDIYMDVDTLQRERESLDGTFAAAKANFSKRGPWHLPGEVVGKFGTIAKQTLVRMGRHDAYDLFSEAVSDEEAPGYSDIVKNPMDFGSMKVKVEKGEYGEGSAAAAEFYNDFLLCMENCALYNDVEGEVMEEAARMFGLLPETFAAACISAADNSRKKRKR